MKRVVSRIWGLRTENTTSGALGLRQRRPRTLAATSLASCALIAGSHYIQPNGISSETPGDGEKRTGGCGGADRGGGSASDARMASKATRLTVAFAGGADISSVSSPPA